jgi:hypothetical protein
MVIRWVRGVAYDQIENDDVVFMSGMQIKRRPFGGVKSALTKQKEQKPFLRGEDEEGVTIKVEVDGTVEDWELKNRAIGAWASRPFG